MAATFLQDSLVEDLTTIFYYLLWWGVPLAAAVGVGYLLFQFFKERGEDNTQDRGRNYTTGGYQGSSSGRHAASKAQLDELRERLSRLEGEVRDIRLRVGLGESRRTTHGQSWQNPQTRHAEALEYSTPRASDVRSDSPGDADGGKYASYEGPFGEICRLYNEAVDDPALRSAFRDRYRPQRIGTVNAMQRRRNPSIPPEFQTTNDGDYFAVVEALQGQRGYVVVPKFDLTFQDANYGPGAMGMVFDCPGYDAGLSYRNVKVVQPAIFEPDANAGWRLVRKGALNLGAGE